MRATVPSLTEPLVDADRTVSNVWGNFFQTLAGASGAAVGVTVTGSPFTYRAPESGHAVIRAGTVTAIAIIRGRVTVPTGLITGIIPLSAGDGLVISYTAPPVLTFLPD